MIIRRTSADALLAAAAAVSLSVDFDKLSDSRGGGETFRVKLNLGEDREHFRKYSPRGRKVNAACWHGFRDFFYALFEESPDAVVKTALATYDGLDGFEREYPRTAFHNVGSVFYPAYPCELCKCPDAGDGY